MGINDQLTQTIKAELTSDPLSRGYDLMTNQEVLDSLLMPSIPGLRTITGRELVAWGGAGASTTVKSRYRRIEDGASRNFPLTEQQMNAAGVTGNVVEGACVAALSFFNSPGDTELNLSLADRQQMLGVLVLGGILTQSESDSLYSMTMGSRALQLGISPQLKHVVWARS